MSQNSNAFQKAAEALSQVRTLIVSGDQLRGDLKQIGEQADASLKRVEQSLKAETAAMSRSAEDVLSQYRSASKEIVGGIRGANEQLEATTTQIRATAIESMNELKEKADTAVKRVSAEVTIARDRFEEAAKKVEGAAGIASDRILEASQRVDRGTTLHGDKLEQVSRRLGELLSAFETGAKAIASAEHDIRLAKQETLAARTETNKAKDEIVALRESMRAQVRGLILTVFVLFLTAIGAVAWMYLNARGG